MKVAVCLETYMPILDWEEAVNIYKTTQVEEETDWEVHRFSAIRHVIKIYFT